MLHSLELMPGGSPTFPKPRDIEFLYHNLEMLFDEIQDKFIGATLKEYYQKNSITQGASLTLEKGEDHTIQITLKRSKKGLSVPNVSYDAKKDRFSLADKEISTTSLPNKIIFLDSDALKAVESLYSERMGVT